ncbi:STAS domain-containing protein [Cellulomonas chengniuliangii]|uniref:STAS domain-containing protein n=1 Tax=Cellulomonas chengniuliangii TaxID=2968084 RepID=A0ABY5KY56_9CELL|nr:STAS domain-containing protein [Cellulomonas chengniuliangii]MCC2307811.1 STAS domain-containing protein [Cellulomonas chengniuliangii]UUI75432.1 STAS domain-containing protein [Cellulomonas chengniuliangii]
MHLIEKTDAAGGIEVDDAEGVVTVRMWGEVDAALREQASQTMAHALTSTARVVVDATEVTFIDSTGLAFILQLHLAAAEQGRRVTLRDPNRTVVGLLDMIGMGGELDLEDEPVTA